METIVGYIGMVIGMIVVSIYLYNFIREIWRDINRRDGEDENNKWSR